MLNGVFQRAAMAIILMGALLAPFGTCLYRTHKAAHSCCARAPEASLTAQVNCCTVSATLPAIVIATNLAGSDPMTVARQFVSADELARPIELPKSSASPPLSPPTGAFILRI